MLDSAHFSGKFDTMAQQKKTYHHGDLRTALIDAATEVIEESGPKALTIRAVANRAGVSHGAPYRHFSDKDALLLAVVERGFVLLEEAMSAATGNTDGSALEQFQASGRAYFTFARKYPAYYRVMFSGDLLSGKGNEALGHTSAGAFLDIGGYLRECQQLGVVRKDDEVLQSIAIISTIHGFVSLLNDNRINHMIDGKYSDSEVWDYLVGAIFRGIGEE